MGTSPGIMSFVNQKDNRKQVATKELKRNGWQHSIISSLGKLYGKRGAFSFAAHKGYMTVN